MTSRNYNNLTFGLLASAAALGIFVGCQTKQAFKPITNPPAVRVVVTPELPESTPNTVWMANEARSSVVAIPPNLKRLPHMETMLPFGYALGLDVSKYRWEVQGSTNGRPWAHVAWITNAFTFDVRKDTTVKTAFYRMKGYLR